MMPHIKLSSPHRRESYLSCLKMWLFSIPACAGMTLLLSIFPARALDSVTVMADPSLSVAITKVAREYSRDRGRIVTISCLPFKMQQEQLTEGGAADVLITPLSQWVDELKTQGLIDVYSPTIVAKTRLALVGPLDGALTIDWSKKPFPVAVIIKNIGAEPGFVVGNPENLPEGIYAMEALRMLDAAQYLEPYTLYPKRIEDMFELVINRKAYGIFFYSSLINRSDVKNIGLLPERLHQPIQYYAVVIAGENMDAARKFLEYLKSDRSQKIFRDNGL